MRKFTLSEVTTLCGHLQLFALSYHCEICKRQRLADMSLVTRTGVPIFVCISCATQLIQISNVRSSRVSMKLKRAAIKAENVAPETKRRGRPRKADNK